MRVGLDLRMLGGGSGVARYISELSREILRQDKRNQYVLFFRGADESAGYKSYGHKIIITGIPHYSWAEQFKLPGVLKSENLDIVHFPHFNIPVRYRAPFVVTIHDLTHTKFPGRKKSHFPHRLAYNWVIRNAMQESRKIIAVSNKTKQEIQEYFRVPEGKIRVIYEGVNSRFQMLDKRQAFDYVAKKFSITKSYLLYVGVWRRYKNVEGLALAFDMLKERGLDYQLVLVGEPDPYYPNIKYQISNIKNTNSVKALGRVSDEDLVSLYNAADLFVLPSLAEGFGLTTLEAAACGVPVACSDIPTLREVMGQGAEYFDPYNPDNMAEILATILQNPIKAAELSNLALARTRHFSWQQAAAETIKLYQSV